MSKRCGGKYIKNRYTRKFMGVDAINDEGVDTIYIINNCKDFPSVMNQLKDKSPDFKNINERYSICLTEKVGAIHIDNDSLKMFRTLAKLNHRFFKIGVISKEFLKKELLKDENKEKDIKPLGVVSVGCRKEVNKTIRPVLSQEIEMSPYMHKYMGVYYINDEGNEIIYIIKNSKDLTSITALLKDKLVDFKNSTEKYTIKLGDRINGVTHTDNTSIKMFRKMAKADDRFFTIGVTSKEFLKKELLKESEEIEILKSEISKSEISKNEEIDEDYESEDCDNNYKHKQIKKTW